MVWCETGNNEAAEKNKGEWAKRTSEKLQEKHDTISEGGKQCKEKKKAYLNSPETQDNNRSVFIYVNLT